MNEDKRLLQKIDPVKKQDYKEIAEEEMSAMSPPEAFEPPAVSKVTYAQMHPYLQGLVDDHTGLTKEMESFSFALKEVEKAGTLTEDNFEGINKFIKYFDLEFIPHNKKEEHLLFPLLKKRFIEVGESSPTRNPITGVDVLENEHIEAIQIATLAFNYFELSSRLKDKPSKQFVLQSAIQKSKILIELLTLHMFREDNIVFGRAAELLTIEELDLMVE